MSAKSLLGGRIARSVTVASTTHVYSDGTSTRVPMIRLRGKWLSAAGFAIGGGIEITVSTGELRIRAIQHGTSDIYLGIGDS